MTMAHEEYMRLKENVKHGDFMFPFTIYGGYIPGNYINFPMHWHEEMEIICVEEGLLEISVDLNSFVAKQGDIILCLPYMLHNMKQYKSEFARINTILFHMNELTGNSNDICMVNYFVPLMNEKYQYPVHISTNMNGYQEIYDSVTILKKLYEEQKPCYEIAIKGELYHLFYLLFQYVFEKKTDIAPPKIEVTKNIKIILEYIQKHFMDPITVEELAGIINLSKHYFMSFFKKYMGTTCVNYINDYRINEATKLLGTTDLTIMEIADRVGVNNVSYFNRIFKSKFGITPKEYRKKILEGE